jgi:hypothetical protein
MHGDTVEIQRDTWGCSRDTEVCIPQLRRQTLVVSLYASCGTLRYTGIHGDTVEIQRDTASHTQGYS